MRPGIARRYVIVLGALALAGAAGTAGVVSMSNPHFIKSKTTSLLNDDGSLEVCFKEAGLGNNQLIQYEATAQVTAVFHCVNNGGQCPDADNKQTVVMTVSEPGEFMSGQNGQVEECLTIQPPEVKPFCPPGQTETLAELSYSDITITDLTNGESSTADPSTQDATLFVCP